MMSDCEASVSSPASDTAPAAFRAKAKMSEPVTAEVPAALLPVPRATWRAKARTSLPPWEVPL